MRTAQQIFDTVVKWLRQQGCQSKADDESCFYRGPAGLKCAVGILLPDSAYNLLMEGNTVLDLVRENKARHWLPDDLANEFTTHMNLLMDLQHAHDSSLPINWEIGFQEIAYEHGLTYTPPEE